MTNSVTRFALVWLGVLVAPLLAAGQDSPVSVSVGPETLTTADYLTLEVTLVNESLRDVGNLPELPGFVKLSARTNSRVSITSQGTQSVMTYTQYYQPQREGTFQLPSFSLSINGERYTTQAKTITVTAAPQVSQTPRSRPDSPDLASLPDRVELQLSVEQPDLFVRQGTPVEIAIYQPTDDVVTLGFDNLAQQLRQLLPDLYPSHVWVEEEPVTQIDRELVSRGGQVYQKLVIYRATLFPLHEGPITLPSKSLTLANYFADRNSIFGRRRRKGFRTYTFPAVALSVKPLPPHPLAATAPVGQFQLQESLEPARTATGELASYSLAVVGNGVQLKHPDPTLLDTTQLEFTQAGSSSEVVSRLPYRAWSRWDYLVKATAAGKYPLAEALQWVYFDPSRQQYDTLRPAEVLTAVGGSLQTATPPTTQPKAYSPGTASKLHRVEKAAWPPYVIAFAMLVLSGLAIFVTFFRPAPPPK